MYVPLFEKERYLIQKKWVVLIVFDSNFRQISYQVSLSNRLLFSVEINSIQTFDNSALDTSFRHEKQSSLGRTFESNLRHESAFRSLNSKVLTKVRQLVRLSKVDSKLLSKVSVKI